VVPDLFGLPGGIARYCCLVAKTLNEWDELEKLDVLALRDQPETRPDGRYLAGGRFSYKGYGGNRLAFGRSVVATMARRRYHLLMSGHANLTPLLFLPTSGWGQVKRVVFAYGTDVWVRLPAYRRFALQHLDRIIAISQYTARRAATANSLSTANLTILHNCLDPSLDSHRALDIEEGFRRNPGQAIVTVSRISRFEAGKGHVAVLRALPTVLRQIPDLCYYIVGDGDLRPDLERLAAALGLGDHVRFLGTLSDDAVGRVLASSQVFVMPGKYEGFGFVFLEAMSHALPIIAGDRDASPEVVADAGLLVNPDDPDQIATALVRLLLDSGLRHRLGAAGQRRLDDLFRYDRFRSKLLADLTRLMQQHRAA
jgi:phosphatidylinositol alpha-1,6-mannosyltransferase